MKDNAPVLIIFGITGDLSKRKLLPAIYHLLSQQLLPENLKIIGVSRHELDIDELLGSVELCVLEEDNVCDPAGIKRLRDSLESFKLDPNAPDDYKKLSQRLEEFDGGSPRDRLFYMSIPSSAYAPIIEQLAAAGLNDTRSRLLLEKPFGYDLSSAKELIDLVDRHFSEGQIYRIDHYLAKETAQNLLTFRLFNPVFTSLWDAEHIASVHVRAIEKIGIEERADFYEKTGALRDLIQSHLMQLLAITLMDLPADMTSQQIHHSKQHFLEQLSPADPTEAVRAQYDTYRQEANNEKSTTETYTKLHLKHGAKHWQGVDIILETGKGLATKTTEIIISFKTDHDHPSNNLTFHIQPDEGITFDLMVKEPGYENKAHHTSLDFDYQKIFKDSQHIDAYERVLMDAVRGDQALFASASEVLATWRILQPVIDNWQGNDQGLITYTSGAAPETIKASN